ncbi:hypothetical protein ACS386_09010 [Flavobacteriaceae bacterium LMO-SS05]
MKKNTLETLFENLKHEFDVENPNDGHELRFLSKLKGGETTIVKLNYTRSSFWKPLMAVAASVVLCVSILIVIQNQSETKDLASISPELYKTQTFFTTAITQELASLNKERSPKTEIIIHDAIIQIGLLEKDYENLKVNLTDSGDDKRVIYAMISNFQNRIDVLQNALKQIEEVKQLNTNQNENNLTI